MTVIYNVIKIFHIEAVGPLAESTNMAGFNLLLTMSIVTGNTILNPQQMSTLLILKLLINNPQITES